MSVNEALKVLMVASMENPREVGTILYETDESGHTLLCRLLTNVAHFGPSGTFVLLAKVKLDAGGSLCAFGVECGEPTKSYMQQQNERWEEFERIQKILTVSGALQVNVWKNPRFSAEGLCKCGKPEEPKLPMHDPLCPYRIRHDFQPTIEEYRKALGQIQ